MSNLASDTCNQLRKFSVEDAIKYGLDCAIVLSHFKEFHLKGYFTPKEVLKYFPYFSEKQFDRILFELEQHKLIFRSDFDEELVIEYLKRKTPQKLTTLNIISGISIYICAWCISQTLNLVRHHYPIRKKDGGDEIVKICANCHEEFHYLCDHVKFRFIGGVFC
jgi:hypothetical protein